MVEIYYQNVRGLKTKMDNVSKNILEANYNIIAFTETWLKLNISNKEVIDSRYKVFRKDRPRNMLNSKSDGGGILLAVSKHIPSHRISLWETDQTDQETLWVLMQLKRDNEVKMIAICVVYMPPPVKLKSLHSFLNSVGVVVRDKRNVVVLGDFNLGSTMQNMPTPFRQTRNKGLKLAITNFMVSNKLFQVNGVHNCDNRLLDLVITNMTNVHVIKNGDILSKLDKRHPSLLINIPI